VKRDFSLYVLVTGSLASAPLEDCIRQVIKGGADAIQLREKDLCDRDLLALARRVREIIPRERAMFVVNDRPDIARLAGADGVHLGQDDLTIEAARCVLGAEAVIGRSTHSIKQAEEALAQGADYIAIGPVFPTATKGYDEGIGIELAGRISAISQAPVVAIGGMKPQRVPELRAAGIKRIAVCSAVISQKDIRASAAAFRSALSI